MANFVYHKARERYMKGLLDWINHDVRIMMTTSGYSALQTHEFLSSVPSGSRSANVALASKTATDGVADAADPTFAAVPGGATYNALVLYRFVTGDADSPLIAYIDTGITGMPIASNGGDIGIRFSDLADRIYRL